MKQRIKFENLSIPLRIAAITSWIYTIIFIIAFIIGYIQG